MPAIRAQNLGKMYRVAHGTPRAHYRMLREAIAAAVMRPIRRLAGTAPPATTYEDFWALKDVSFDIMPGEVVGIIGRNGAGKSTLLKVLSRITKPTTGNCVINGRVGSLLEVGTGFHPELTGRENVYLNGSLLGMTRREIERKFDEIVAFSEVEKFLDTPVKRYSSGMYVRLAFAVAAHLEPEILIVDEVLAVGDAGFQKKCLGKIQDVGQQGRTVLFVSHNVTAVQTLTHKCILLRSGQIQAIGPTDDVIHEYLDTGVEMGCEWTRRDTPRGKHAWISAIRCLGVEGRPEVTHAANKPVTLAFEFTVTTASKLQVAFRVVSNHTNETVFSSALGDGGATRETAFEPGRYVASCEIPGHMLVPGTYNTLAAIIDVSESGVADLVDRALCFEISSVGSLTALDHRLGAVAPLLPWQVRPA
jgi:lipopolysaccharide transport system ATP-binding protein